MRADSSSFEMLSHAEPLPRTALDRLIWPLLLVLAWLAFELTANATLSLALTCLKFGMNDFRTAMWLWQVDPQRPRALACASFYVASGVWKTAIFPLLVAGSISIAWALYSPNAMQPIHPVTIQLQKAMLVGVYAAALLVLLVVIAVLLSLTAKWRVWVHPSLHHSRTEQIWPPFFSPFVSRHTNQAKLIVVTSIFVLVLVGPIATLSMLSQFAFPFWLRTALSLSVIFGFPMFSVVSLAMLRTKLFAESPWECWPESIRQLGTSDYTSKASTTSES